MRPARAVEAIELRREFAGYPAVVGLDLDVQHGEVHAIVGLNGAGKTTLFRLLLGMLRPDSGRARVLDTDAFDAPADVWRRVGHLVAAPLAYPELTVQENLVASARLHGVAASAIDAAVAAMVDRFALGQWMDRRATHLSTGNRQRLGLAAALLHAPDVVVLDEPANGLDPAGVVLVRDLLAELRDGGAAVLVSSHHLHQLARVADRITVLHRGKRVGRLDPTGAELEQAFFDLVNDAELAIGEAS